MQTCVILSTPETPRLPLVLSMAKKEKKMNVILLSDAVFLLDDASNENFFKTLEDCDVTIIATRDDLEKRKLLSKDNLMVVDYESLVNILLSEPTRTVNI